MTFEQGQPKEVVHYYAKQQAEFKDWVQCPSNYPGQFESVSETMFRRRTRVFKAGSDVEGTFGNDKSQAWKSFVKSIAKGDFHKTVNGTLFPKRSEVTQSCTKADDLSEWEDTVERFASKKSTRRQVNSVQCQRQSHF